MRYESDCLRCLGGKLDFGGGNIFPFNMSLMCCTMRLIATIYGNNRGIPQCIVTTMEIPLP